MSAQILAIPITLVIVGVIAFLVWYPMTHPQSGYVRAVVRMTGAVAGYIDWLVKKGAYIASALIVGFGIALLWILVVVILEDFGVGR